MFYASALEDRYSKDDLLQRYLNQVYFGEGAYGAQSAARNYFGKEISDLSLADCALLAGLIRAPATFSPWSNYEGGLERSRLVLAQMRDQGLITEAQEKAARTVRPATRTVGAAGGKNARRMPPSKTTRVAAAT